MNPPFHDTNLKTLPDDVVQALYHQIDKTPISEWIALPTEVPRTGRRVDDAYLCRLGEKMKGIHFEYQIRPDPSMPRRMYEYDFDLQQMILQQYGEIVPIQSIVVWLGPGQTPYPAYIETDQRQILALHQYHEIHLNQLDWRADLDPVLLVLSPYFASVKADDLVEIAVQMYEQAPDNRRDQLLGSLIAISERTYQDFDEIKSEILRKVGKQMNDLAEALINSPMVTKILEQQTAIAARQAREEAMKEGLQEGLREGLKEGLQEGKAEGLKEGLQEGKAEGLKEGLQEGRKEGLRKGRTEGRRKGKTDALIDAIAVLWQQQFLAPLPDNVRTMLGKRSEKRLLELVAILGTHPTEEDFRQAIRG